MAEKKVYGLLGKNISYSLSPEMHTSAFRHFALNSEYKIFDVQPRGDWNEFLSELVLKNNVFGFNVTVPYKIEILNMLKSVPGYKIDTTADFSGAVNTVKIDNTKFAGYNTDGRGFYESLLEDACFDPKGKDVFIFGAGGAGRAVCLYLASLKITDGAPRNIYIKDVDPVRVQGLVTSCNEKIGKKIAISIEKDKEEEILNVCDLIVNATHLGTGENDPVPFQIESLKKEACVYDLVYARETDIVISAKEKGMNASNGLGMLANQGALAFNIWTEGSFNLPEIKKVMKAAISRKLR